MVDYGDTVIVALSGGADSVCLLHNLVLLKDKYNLKVMACHLNHHLRGEESNSDMEFCKELCRQNNIELFVKEVDIDKLSNELKISHEECGRNCRYEFFNSLAEKYNAKIATAHNSDDNLETTIYNMTRGALLKGLSGIPKVRDYIIRPLINTSREIIEEYCKGYGLKYVTDSTNLTDEYTRNKIRHNVIPVLKEINPSVENTVLQMNSTLSEIAEYIEKSGQLLLKIAQSGEGYLTNKLRDANIVVLKEAIAILFRQNHFSYSRKHIEETLTIIENGGKINLKKKLSAINKQGLFRIAKTNDTEFYSAKINIEKPIVYNDKVISFENVKINGKFDKFASKNYISSDIITPSLRLRNRLAGDTIYLAKRKVTKSLKKLMNELKIPDYYISDIADTDERARYDIDEGWILIILRIPYVKETRSRTPYTTIPLGIIMKGDVLITVCNFETNMMIDFVTYQQKRGLGFTDSVDMVFRLFLSSAVWYLKRLKQISARIDKAKQNLDKNVNNVDLINLSRLQDSLTYFVTSIRGNENLLSKLKFKLPVDELDADMIEDVNIEMSQARETTNIYSNILDSTMDTYANIINNNMSSVMNSPLRCSFPSALRSYLCGISRGKHGFDVYFVKNIPFF